MPPPAPPIPVQFDQQKAQDAMDALQAAARLLQDRMSTDMSNASNALDGWTGHHHDTFAGSDLPWMRSEAARIIDGILKLRMIIAGAAASAAVAQAAQKKQAH
jgi:hypothetical protein